MGFSIIPLSVRKQWCMPLQSDSTGDHVLRQPEAEYVCVQESRRMNRVTMTPRSSNILAAAQKEPDFSLDCSMGNFIKMKFNH